MKKLLLSLLAFSCLVLCAQQKTISFDQAFRDAPVSINKPLPVITRWVDDNQYVEARREAGKTKSFVVNLKTAASIPFEDEKLDSAKSSSGNSNLPKEAKNVTWSPDKKWAAYTLNHNLIVRNGASGEEIKITTDGSETIKNGYASWVYFEEILGRGSRYRAFWWSDDSKRIAFMRFDDSKVPTFPIYVLKDQHGYLENERYPKVGDPNPEVRFGIADISTGKTTWADFNEKDDQYFGAPTWTPDGQCWLPWVNRGQDQFKLYSIDLANGSKKEIYSESQSTWVDIGGKITSFLPDNKGFILRSDKSGWAHYYIHDMSGKLISQPTSGDYTTGPIHKIDAKNKKIYFSARKENSARWDLYSVSFDGSKLKRLSFGDYSFSGMNFSPGNKYFITSYSNISTPTTMVVMDLKGKVIKEIANGKGTDFANVTLPKKEIVRVKSDDGLFDLPVLITYPVNFDPNKKYPVIASIYGGPNAGRIMDTWQASPVETWWAQEGMIQVVFDNRSSGHFGKKGMNYIHRKMGIHEIEDYMTCGKWLKQQSFVDPNRIGITGGSFGGYLTCMALTYGADVFTHGVALAAVTDWQFYDSYYTEKFMDTPKENPEGYKETSVMTHADKLKGSLRIVHGTTDDNVHMQNSMVLIDKLQNLRKRFEFMLYPGERHSIGANNAAKSLHNRTETYNYYYEQLLQKPFPAEFLKAPGSQKGF